MHYRVDIRPAGRSRCVRSARVRDCGLGCRCQRSLLIGNPNVRIAPCTMRGDVRGVWINGRARICGDREAAHGQQLLTQRYGLLKIVGDFFSRLMRHKQTVIAVEFD